MKILIALRAVAYNGQTTFCLTIAEELQRRGHVVSFYYEEKTIGPLLYPFFVEGAKYDLLIVNQRLNCFKYPFKHSFKDFKKRVFCVHSLMNKAFLPVEAYDEVFVFSSRAKLFIAQKGIESTLIPQPIDFKMFHFNPVDRACQRVFLFDVRSSFVYREKLQQACNLLNLELLCLDNPVDNVMPYIYASDLVLAYGRCAIESMLCGRKVLIYGISGGDGLVTEGNVHALEETNFSGWTYQAFADPLSIHLIELVQMLQLAIYTPVDLKAIRDRLCEFDVRCVVDKLV